MDKRELKALVIKAIQKTVEASPEIIKLLNSTAYCYLIESELEDLRAAFVSGKGINAKYTPEPLIKMLIQMLGYTHGADQIDVVFDDVITFFKQDSDRPQWWHDRTRRYEGTFIPTPGDIELTQDDIDEAVSEWDRIMGDYSGLLDASVEVNNA